MFGRLKDWRRIATRYGHTASSFLRFVQLAAVRLWISFGQTAYLPVNTPRRKG